MSHSTKTKSLNKNAWTQTSDTDFVLEIARLQKQIKLLTIKNRHWEKHATEISPSTSNYISLNTSQNNIHETLKVNESKSEHVQSQSAQKKYNKLVNRGCSCKGNCSSKLCGCTKKGVLCGESCKCNSVSCKNQQQKDIEQNKENLENAELARKHETESLPNDHLTTDDCYKSIFDPNITMQDTSSVISSCEPKQLLFASDEEEDKDEKAKKKSMKNNKNMQNGVTQRKSRPKKNNLKVSSKYIKELRCQSTEETHRRSDIEIEEKILRSCSSNEILVETDEHFKQRQKQTRQYVKNVTQGMKSLRRHRKDAKENTTVISVKCDSKKMLLDVTNEIPNSNQEQIDSDNMEDHDEEFDPMKPKHELPRTPTSGNSSTNSHSTSKASVSPPIFITNEEEEEEKELPPPAELSQPIVNWEEYQSQLVPCHKCKRKFHPFRIGKHQSCCKKM